jgi:hypothetical protein
MITQEGNLRPTVPEFQLGVLLVHGIGTPRRGDTLVRWGDVLLKTIGHATGEKVVTTIERAVSSDPLGKGLFEAAVRLRTDGHTERWLLAEGRWAGAFPAPSYRELVSWSVRALPWSIATHVAQRYWQETARDWGWKKAVALARALGQLLVALALAPVLIGLLGLALLLGLLPIPQLRAQIVAVQSTLTATVGDSLAFVDSPMRAALIRSCIVDGLEQLKQRCAHTVIAAHSQGAAATLDALGGFSEPGNNDEAEAFARRLPDALVTFGAGTNQLASQKVLAAGGLGRSNPAIVAALSLVLLIVLGIGLSWILQTYSWLQLMRDTGWMLGLTIAPVLGIAILFLLSLAIARLIYWLIVGLIKLYELGVKHVRVSSSSQPDRFSAMRFRVLEIVLPVTFASYCVGATWFFWDDPFPDLRLGLLFSERAFFISLIMMVVASVLLVASISFILSPQMQTIVNAAVRKPPGLSRWVDLYASADPVPNGPTKTIQGEDADESTKIWNLGSVVADHTAYWDNRDGFVLRVVRVFAETAQSPWRDALPRVSGLADQRAAWRVGFLRIARWTTGILWLVLGALIWHQTSIEVLFKLPTWLTPAWFPAALGQRALFVAVIALVIWASSSILRWVWSLWVHSEQQAVLAHKLPSEVNWDHPFLNIMCITIWMLIGAIGVIYFLGPELLKAESLAGVTDTLTDPGPTFSLIIAVLVVRFSPLVLLGLWPPPRPFDPWNPPSP